MKPLNRLTSLFNESVIRMMTSIYNQHWGINLSQGFPDWDSPQMVV